MYTYKGKGCGSCQKPRKLARPQVGDTFGEIVARARATPPSPRPFPQPRRSSGFSPPHHSHYSLTPANEKSLAVDGIAKLSLHFRAEKARIYVHGASKISDAIDRGWGGPRGSPLSEINGPAPLRHFGFPGIKFKARSSRGGGVLCVAEAHLVCVFGGKTLISPCLIRPGLSARRN